MQTQDTQEQRRFLRWQIDRPAQLKLEGAEACSDCRIKDISFKGVKVILRYKLTVDTFIKLKVMLNEDCSFDAEVWVVWHKQILDTNVYGFYFSRIADSDKEKIYKFLMSNYPALLRRQLRGEQSQTLTEGGYNMEDKRIFSRIGVALPVKFLDPSTNNEASAVTCDISAKGVGLVVDRQLNPNTDIEMWIKMPDDGTPLYSRGKVVWSNRVAEGKFRTGVSLEKADLMGLSRALRAG